MTENVKKLLAYRCIAQPTRLKLVLIIVKEGGNKGLSFNKLRRELGVNSNTLDYHLGKLVSTGLLNNYPVAPKLRKAKVAGLRGVRIPPNIVSGANQTKAFSYYKLTSDCSEILSELNLVTPQSIEKTLKEIEKGREYLKEKPII